MLEPINQENRNRYKYCTKKCHCVAELGHFHYLNLLKFIASSLDINMDLFANRKCATFLSIHILFPFFFCTAIRFSFFLMQWKSSIILLDQWIRTKFHDFLKRQFIFLLRVFLFFYLIFDYFPVGCTPFCHRCIVCVWIPCNAHFSSYNRTNRLTLFASACTYIEDNRISL